MSYIEYIVRIYKNKIEYHVDGKLHRDGAPAIESFNGTMRWYQYGELHRDDGPAIEHADGSKYWYKHGKLHREDGPAMEPINGNRVWYIDGEPHRFDGPAYEDINPEKNRWYIFGIELSEEQFLQLRDLSTYSDKEIRDEYHRRGLNLEF